MWSHDRTSKQKDKQIFQFRKKKRLTNGQTLSSNKQDLGKLGERVVISITVICFAIDSTKFGKQKW